MGHDSERGGASARRHLAPDEALATLGELVAEANRRLNIIRSEVNRITGQWEALGRLGAQRADHGAQLLGHLRPLLRDLGRYATACAAQIEATEADPFGRGE